ncbi:MAG: ATP-binding domain-containing protein [Moorellales bacterium]
MLCSSRERAAEFLARLAALPGYGRAKDRLKVLALDEAQGAEFDAVLLDGTCDPADPGHARAFYTAAGRAAHHLFSLASGPAS